MKYNIYVATSWKNEVQPRLVRDLKSLSLSTYDFRHPEEGNDGFRWTDTGMNPHGSNIDYLKTLKTPVAEQGFKLDMDALESCEICILVLPSGRSAHLEAGYAVGAGKKVAVLLSENEVVPELMYKMCDLITEDYELIIRWAHHLINGGADEEFGFLSDHPVEMFDRLSEEEL